jgi:hypothetical protein
MKTCENCSTSYEPKSNSQKYCPTCSDKMRRKAIRASNKRLYQKRKEELKGRAQRRRAEALFEEFGTNDPNDFIAAVRYPPKKDVRVHIACIREGFPDMFIDARSFKSRKWTMRPAPVRDITCRRCRSMWKAMFGDLPVPVVTSEWSDEDRALYGF